MHLADIIAASSASATVCASLIGVQTYRLSRKEKVTEMQRKLDRAEQTEAIRDAISDFSDKVTERFDKNDEISADASRRLQRLEDEQFGPNHGGARQAINELTAKVDDMSPRIVRVETLLAQRS